MAIASRPEACAFVLRQALHGDLSIIGNGSKCDVSEGSLMRYVAYRVNETLVWVECEKGNTGKCPSKENAVVSDRNFFM